MMTPGVFDSKHIYECNITTRKYRNKLIYDIHFLFASFSMSNECMYEIYKC